MFINSEYKLECIKNISFCNITPIHANNIELKIY